MTDQVQRAREGTVSVLGIIISTFTLTNMGGITVMDSNFQDRCVSGREKQGLTVLLSQVWRQGGVVQMLAILSHRMPFRKLH